MAEEYPRGTVRAVPGNPLTVVCRIPKDKKTVDFVTEALKKYADGQDD